MAQVLSERFAAALTLMQRKARLESELESLDTSTSEGTERRDALQREIGGIYDELHSYPKEMGKITSIVYDCDDPHLTVPSLTPDKLAHILASSGGRNV